MLNTKSVTILFGATFILVGLFGFVPNPLVAPDGLFAVNAVHNLVHIVTGAAFLAGALAFAGKSRLTLRTIGIGYIAVTILGFLTTGDKLLWIIHINEADRWLHLLLAAAILAASMLPEPVESEIRAA